MPRNNEYQFLCNALSGHIEAVEFCRTLFRISQVWDDLVDGDESLSTEDINKVFWECLVELPQNPFYQRHFFTLQPLLREYIIQWLDANTLEQGSDHDQNIAFALRDGIGGIISQCAYIIGGYERMRAVSPEIRKHIFEEPLENYKDELNESRTF